MTRTPSLIDARHFRGAHPSEVMTLPGAALDSLDTDMRDQRATEQIGASMTDETPVLDTLADITAISLERCALPPRELMLARIAALIAVDAPPASYTDARGSSVSQFSSRLRIR
jgi:hypothetical protein